MGFKQQAQKHAASGGGGFKAKKVADQPEVTPTASTPAKASESKVDPLTAANLGLGPTETDIAIAKAGGFRKWAKKCHLWIHPSIDIMVPVKGMGYGVVAIAPVQAGETIFSVPHECYINPSDTNVPNCPAAKLIDSHKPAIPDWTRSVLRLMAEKARGLKSPWAPWFDCAVIPEDHLFLVGDDATKKKVVGAEGEEAKKDLLNPSLWGQSAISQQLEDYDLEARYAAITDFLALHPSVWPDEGKKAVTSFRCFKECAAFVVSRNFHIEARQRPGPFLVPAVDFLNHSNRGKPHVKFVLTGGREKGLTFEVRATEDLVAGKQVFHDYGELSNSRLLVEFGFKLSGYASDSVRLSHKVLVRMGTHTALSLQTPTQGAVLVEKEVEADMRERVMYLGRIGILYEEGLFVLKGVLNAHAAGGGLEFGESEKSLIDVMYCLSRSTKEWNDVKGKLARWWHVEGRKNIGEAAYFGAAALGWLVGTMPSKEVLTATKPAAGSNAPTSYMNESVRSVLTTDLEKLQLAIGYLSSKAIAPTTASPTAGGSNAPVESKCAAAPNAAEASPVPLPQQKLQMGETKIDDESEEEWNTDSEDDE